MSETTTLTTPAVSDHGALLDELQTLGVTAFELRLAQGWSAEQIREHIASVRAGRALHAAMDQG
jgi:hypothetical protein